MRALRTPRRLPRRGEEDALRLTSPFTRQPLLACCSFSHKHGGFQFPRRLSHPDKRRRSHKLHSQRTCAARRIRLRRMRLAAAIAAAPCRPALAGAGRRAAHSHSPPNNNKLTNTPHGSIIKSNTSNPISRRKAEKWQKKRKLYIERVSAGRLSSRE